MPTTKQLFDSFGTVLYTTTTFAFDSSAGLKNRRGILFSSYEAGGAGDAPDADGGFGVGGTRSSQSTRVKRQHPIGCFLDDTVRRGAARRRFFYAARDQITGLDLCFIWFFNPVFNQI